MLGNTTAVRRVVAEDPYEGRLQRVGNLDNALEEAEMCFEIVADFYLTDGRSDGGDAATVFLEHRTRLHQLLVGECADVFVPRAAELDMSNLFSAEHTKLLVQIGGNLVAETCENEHGRLLVNAGRIVYGRGVKDKRELAEGIVRRLREAGHAAMFAGGCVRDMLRGVEPRDYDIATSARPAQISRLFSKTKAVGAQFGVMLVLVYGRKFEVATFRVEGEYRDGRRPDRVEFSDAEHDARRRDFTINGLFFDPIENRVLDFVGGKSDLEQKIIRTIGVPEERFAEDKLRLLRCVRFASTLGFEIEPQTFRALRRMAGEIRSVSAERVREELTRLLTGPNAGRGLTLLDQSGLLRVILPEVAAMKGVEQPPQFHPEGDVFTHTRLVLEHLREPTPTLAFAALLHDVGKPPTFQRAADRIRFHEHDRVGAEMTDRILRRLRFPNVEREAIIACVANHMRFKDAPKMRKATLKRLLARPTFAVELEMHRADCLASHRKLDNYELLLRVQGELTKEQLRPKPLLNGHDLLRMGYKEGPGIGRVLKRLEELQLAEEIHTRVEALRFARQQRPAVRAASRRR